jgi:hypothetical protein
MRLCQAVDHTFRDHLEITEFRASLVEESVSPSLVLAVKSLTVLVSQSGLNQVIKHLVPDYQVEVRVEHPRDGIGADLVTRAQQWGFAATVRTEVRADADTPGGVRFVLKPASRWSPLDQTMLNVMSGQIRRISRERADLTPVGPHHFAFDLRSLIQQRIVSSGAPLRWDTSMSRILANNQGLGFVFTPYTGEQERADSD